MKLIYEVIRYRCTCPVCNGDCKYLHNHHVTYQPERTAPICERCHSVISTDTRNKKKRLHDDYEKVYLTELYKKLGKTPKHDKHKIQTLIDEVLVVGRERYISRKNEILSYLRSCFPTLFISENGRAVDDKDLLVKSNKCIDCNRPISHTGRCLNCNRKRRLLASS